MSEVKAHLQKEAQEKLLGEWVDGPFVCNKLKICNRTLFDLRKSGRLKFTQFSSRKILYKLSDIEEFIQKGYK